MTDNAMEEKSCGVLSKKWYDFITKSDEIDLPVVERGLEWLYKICGFAPPKEVIVADSPLDAQHIANKLCGDKVFTYYPFGYESLSGSCGWVAYIEMLQDLGLTKTEFREYKEYMYAGVYSAIFFDTVAIVVRRPQYVKLND